MLLYPFVRDRDQRSVKRRWICFFNRTEKTYIEHHGLKLNHYYSSTSLNGSVGRKRENLQLRYASSGFNYATFSLFPKPTRPRTCERVMDEGQKAPVDLLYRQIVSSSFVTSQAHRHASCLFQGDYTGRPRLRSNCSSTSSTEVTEVSRNKVPLTTNGGGERAEERQYIGNLECSR